MQIPKAYQNRKSKLHLCISWLWPEGKPFARRDTLVVRFQSLVQEQKCHSFQEKTRVFSLGLKFQLRILTHDLKILIQLRLVHGLVRIGVLQFLK